MVGKNKNKKDGSKRRRSVKKKPRNPLSYPVSRAMMMMAERPVKKKPRNPLSYPYASHRLTK
jgi:hypothetical protein